MGQGHLSVDHLIENIYLEGSQLGGRDLVPGQVEIQQGPVHLAVPLGPGDLDTAAFGHDKTGVGGILDRAARQDHRYQEG